MRLRHVDGGLHEWSASTDDEKSFGYASRRESFRSAAHVWEPLLTTTHKSSLWGDEEESDLLARDATDDFHPHAGSFARPASLDSRKDSGDNHDSNKKDDDGKSGSGKNSKKGDSGDGGKYGGDDGYKGGGDDGGKGGGDDGGKGGDDGGDTRKIPEPGSLILFGTGLLIGGALLRKFAA